MTTKWTDTDVTLLSFCHLAVNKWRRST